MRGWQRWARAGSAWRLLRALFPWSDRPDILPVIAARETFDAAGLLRGVALLRRAPSPLLAGAGALYALALVALRLADAPVIVPGALLVAPLIVLVPSLLVWALPLALTLAPLIAREREARTWEVLRMTPHSPEDLLLSKAQGALASLRRALRPLWHAQMHLLIALLGGGGVTVLLSGGLLATRDDGMLARQNALCFGAVFVVMAALAAYLLDRTQQFVLMAVAALAASAATSSVRAATVAATGAVFLAWGVDLAAGVIVLSVQPPGEVYDLGFSLVAMTLLGPLVGYLLELPLALIVLATLATLVVRAAVIGVLWRVAVRQAARI